MKTILNCGKFSALTLATVSALAAFSTPAHAINFRMSNGIANPFTGATNQGAYSDYYTNDSFRQNVHTVDFNNGSAPTTGFAKYSFESRTSSVRKDMWAPVGPDGQKNDSSYLAAFSGSKVTIDLASSLNYFGIDWGAAHAGNTFSFLKSFQDASGKLQYREVKTFTTADIEKGMNKTSRAGYTQVGNDWVKTDASTPGFARYSKLHPGGGQGALVANNAGGQGNGYVHFYADRDEDIFDRIVISQVGGGGFETDNHSFHKGIKAFNVASGQSVPEPGMVLGLLGIVGLAARKRKGARA